MNKLININGKYGAKVGNITVFTKEGAVEAFKTFQSVCYRNGITMEGITVLCEVEKDMVKLGFTYEYLEKLDNEYWQSC